MQRVCKPIILIAVLIVVGCRENSPRQSAKHDDTAIAPERQSISPSSPTEIQRKKQTLTCGQSVAIMLAGLITEYDLHSDKDVVEEWATAGAWSKLPDQFSKSQNASVSYIGTVFDHKLIIAQGQTSGMFSVATAEDFDRESFLDYMKGFVDLKLMYTSNEFGGQREIFRISTNGRYIGYLLLNYGTHEAIRGTGSASFMSNSAYTSVM